MTNTLTLTCKKQWSAPLIHMQDKYRQILSPALLTVVAVSPRVRRHRAVTSEVLPLLDTHTHVGTRVLLAGRAWAWKKARGREIPQEHSQATIRAAEP